MKVACLVITDKEERMHQVQYLIEAGYIVDQVDNIINVEKEDIELSSTMPICEGL